MSIQNLNKFGGKMLKIVTTPVLKRIAPSVASCRTIYLSSCTKRRAKLTVTDMREQRKTIENQRNEIVEQVDEIEERRTEIEERRKEIEELRKEIGEQWKTISGQIDEKNEKRQEIEEQRHEITIQGYEINRQKYKIEKQKKEIKELSITADILELGHYAHKLRSDIITKIFPDRSQVPLKTTKQVEECASESEDFKMTDEEVGRWKKFTSDVSEEGISIEEVDKDLQSLIDRSLDTVVNPKIK